MSQGDYRVELDHFEGPLDLLLHLVKKEEVDIHDIPISRILDQYMKYLEAIAQLDLDAAGDFLVMASTLMVIKSRMLLPSEEVDLDEEIDPRYELVQQLLEYKRLKDSGQLLQDRAQVFSQRVGRPETARPAPVKGEDRSLDEVGLFELLEAFSRVLESIGVDRGNKERRIRVGDRPVRAYMDQLTERLEKERSLLFSQLLEHKTRQEAIGWFLAILVLLKQEVLLCAQDGQEGDIRILYKGRAKPVDDDTVEADLDDDFR